MRLIFWASDKDWEGTLADAFAAGHGDWERRDKALWTGEPEGDGAACVGLKSREIVDAYRAAGKPVVILDKGYSRMGNEQDFMKTAYWRVSLNDYQPTDYLFRDPLPGDRWATLARKYKHNLKSRITGGEFVYYFASSEKYHKVHDLPSMNDYARSVVGAVRKRYDGPVMYCPKPQAYGKGKIDIIPGAFLRHPKDRLDSLLPMGHCAVVHGSGAGVGCILGGLPVITLGNAITKPVSSTSLDAVAEPYWPEPGEREQWAFNLAYAQWTPKEMASGACWRFQLRCLEKYGL